jgi:hypothetical protein
MRTNRLIVNRIAGEKMRSIRYFFSIWRLDRNYIARTNMVHGNAIWSGIGSF